MLEVEVARSEWCMQELRQRRGHVDDDALQFLLTDAWVEMFGNCEVEYEPETYRPRPYSKKLCLAICRLTYRPTPDEHFVETFAVVP